MSERLVQVKFRLTKEEKEKLDELVNTSTNSMNDFLKSKVLCEDLDLSGTKQNSEVEVFSIEVNEAVLKKKKYPVPILTASQKKEIIYDLDIEFYQNYSWNAYFLWIMNKRSFKSGLSLEKYIINHLERLEDIPKWDDIMRNFNNIGIGQLEHIYAHLRCEEVQKASDLVKYMAKVKKLVSEEIKKGEPYLGDF